MIADLFHRGWWILLVRGVTAGLFGILVLVWPHGTVAGLDVLFGVYALVDGAFVVLGAVTYRRLYADWRLLRVQGLASIAVGLIVFGHLGTRVSFLLFQITIWSLTIGLIDIIAGITLWDETRNEWTLLLGGIAYVLLGGCVFVLRDSGLRSATWLLVLGSVAVGLLFTILALRMRAWHRSSTLTLPYTV